MNKKIVSLIMIILFISSCGKEEVNLDKQEVVKKYAQTEILQEKPFSEKLKLTGKVSSSKEANISAQMLGQIKVLNYKVGDKVKEGDIVAIIDNKTNLLSINLNNAINTYNNTANVYSLTKESVESDLELAKASLENAKTSKENTYKTTEEQLKLAEIQFENIKNQTTNTKISTDSTIELTKKSIETSKLNLENFEKNSIETLNTLNVKKKALEDKKNGLLDTIDSNIKSSLSIIDSSITYTDTILGVSDLNKNLNDAYEIFLGAKNSSTKVNAEDNYNKAKSYYNNLISSNDDTFTKLENVKTLVDKTVTLYDSMVKMLDSSITSTSFPDSSLANMKTTIKLNQSSVLGIKTSLISLKNSYIDLENSINDINATISSTKTSLETQKATLEQAIIMAEASLQNTIAGTSVNINNLSGAENLTKNQLENTIAIIKSSRDAVDNALNIAQNNYNSINAKLKTQLASTKTQLDSVNGQKQTIEGQIDNTIIKAPFSGIITSKFVEVGTLVNPGTPIFSISGTDSIIVKMDMNSDNIKQIVLGQAVVLKKEEKTNTGSISLISKSADPITKMYKVEVSVKQEDFKTKFVLGDYLDVYVLKENIESKKFLIIPFTSLLTSSTGDFTVYTIGSGSVVESKKIKIGDSNGDEVIVNDGLKVGDKIVTGGTLNLQEGDIIEEN